MTTNSSRKRPVSEGGTGQPENPNKKHEPDVGRGEDANFDPNELKKGRNSEFDGTTPKEKHDPDVGGGEDANFDPNELEKSRNSEFDGTTLKEILRERSIPDSIIEKCSTENVTSIAKFRQLTYSQLVQYFKDPKISFIAWKHMEGLWSGDVIPIDYIPPVRKQCRENGINLKYAEIFEELEVSDLKDVDEEILQEVKELACSGCEEGGQEEGNVDKCIDNIRSASEKVKDENSNSNLGGNNGSEEGGEGEASARERTIEAANTMRDNVRGALEDLNTQDLAKLNADDLKQKLNDLKGMVQSPIEMNDIGNNFLGHDGLLDKMNTNAIFELSTDYIPSYTDNKDLIAAASGGLALNGIGVFSEQGTTLCSSTLPVLAPPERVTTLGVFKSFQSKILKTTSESEASSFQSSASSLGMSMAESMQFEASASVSVNSRFGASVSASAARGTQTSNSESEQKDSNSSSLKNTKTHTAQITEYIMMPMQAFRIPRRAMKLSEEAIMELREVNNKRMARSFFTKFGTHVSRARHTMGGVFIRQISLTSDKSVSTNKMFSSAGKQLEESKTKSTQVTVEGEGATPAVQVSAAAAASYSRGHASSMGSLKVDSEEDGEGSASCTYTFDTNCLGPNASSPEEFARVLQANNATWACIDRGDPTSLMPIWDIIKSESTQINIASKGLSRTVQGKITTDDMSETTDDKNKEPNDTIETSINADIAKLRTNEEKSMWVSKMMANPSIARLPPRLRKSYKAGFEKSYEAAMEKSYVVKEAADDENEERNGTNGTLTNADIAKLLSDTWYDMLPPSKKKLWNENPSMKYLLRKSNTQREIYHELSLDILEFAGIITYNDEAKYNALQNAVGESCDIMQNHPDRIIKMYPSTWIKDFLDIGNTKLNEEDKTILDSMGGGNITVHQEAATLASQFSRHDWKAFKEAFHQLLAQCWIQQENVKQWIQTDGAMLKISLSSDPSLEIGAKPEVDLKPSKELQHQWIDSNLGNKFFPGVGNLQQHGTDPNFQQLGKFPKMLFQQDGTDPNLQPLGPFFKMPPGIDPNKSPGKVPKSSHRSWKIELQSRSYYRFKAKSTKFAGREFYTFHCSIDTANSKLVSVGSLGKLVHLKEEVKDEVKASQQRFVPYKPMGTFADPDQFVFLSGKDTRYCLNFDSDKTGTPLKTTLLSASTHNVFRVERD